MRSIFKIVLVFALIAVSTKEVYSQQDPHYTQYMYNTMSVNPAYAGSKGYGFFTALARTQWVGFEGAPDTQTLGYDAPIEAYNLGLGINFVNDKIGPAKETSLDANIAYHLMTGETSNLSFGLKLGGRLLSVDPYSIGKIKDRVDPNLPVINNKFLPTLGAGLFYYTNEFYAGLSVPNFLRTEHYDLKADNGSIAVERFHFFLIAGYVFDLNDNIKFKPATILKAVSGAPLSLDVSANFLFNEKFRLGVAWRWDDSVSALVGVNLSERLQIGYAYDLTTSNYGNYNSGTHEIMLTYGLFKAIEGIKSPRFF